MLNIGCHLSTSKGYKQMGKTALQIGGNTFQFFTRNPRGSKAKQLDEKDLAGLRQLMQENNFVPLLAHAPYTLNMCSPQEQTYDFARLVIEDDLKRMDLLPGNMYTFHPGNHGGQGLEKGIEQIANILNEVIKPEYDTTILLELMSGKGTEVGKTFEELQLIMEQIDHAEKLGLYT
jgi:deoxyribonuclease-4